MPETAPPATETDRAYTWRVTRDAKGRVSVDIGDAFPKNDGPDGMGLTKASYDAVTTHTIGKALLTVAQHLLSSRFDEDDYDDDFDDDFDDEDED